MAPTVVERSAGSVSDGAPLGACPAVDTVLAQFHEVVWERLPCLNAFALQHWRRSIPPVSAN
eukprot:7308830-Alexandrium_andersonii.AAC.1